MGKRYQENIYFNGPSETSLTIFRNQFVTVYFVVRRDGWKIVDFTLSISLVGSNIDINLSDQEMGFLKSFLGSIDDCKPEELPVALLEMRCDSQQQQQRYN